MKIKQYLKLDENAVAPVIGVILLVAITVMLTSVIGAYTLGFSDKLSHSCDIQSFTDSITGDAPAYNATNTTDTTDTNTTGTNTTDGNETTLYDVGVTVDFYHSAMIIVTVSGGTDLTEIDIMTIDINNLEFFSVGPIIAHPEGTLVGWMLDTKAPAFEQPISIGNSMSCDEYSDVDAIGDEGTNHVVVIATFLDGSTQTVYDATV